MCVAARSSSMIHALISMLARGGLLQDEPKFDDEVHRDTTHESLDEIALGSNAWSQLGRKTRDAR